MPKNDEKRNLEEELKELKPEDIFRPLDKIRASAPPLEPLWAYFFFKKCVTSLTGDPGISKTSLGYSMFTTLSSGEPYLGIKPTEPIKVLNMDFESSDSLIASRSELVVTHFSPNFVVYNLMDYYLPQVATVIVDYCKANGINVILIDNQTMAFNTRDENDNAEAKREMRFLRSMAVACNASLVIYHHPSKSNAPGTRKGSGAYTRARLADIMINLDYPSEDNTDIMVLRTVKNRLIDDKVEWYLKKSEGKFEFCNPPVDLFRPAQPTNTLVYRAQEKILELINGNKEYKTDEIVSMLEKHKFDKFTVGNALKRLKQQRRLTSNKFGYYQKPK